MTIYHSSDGGKTWKEVEPKPGSIIATMVFDPNRPWSDGFGNLYWDRKPEK